MQFDLQINIELDRLSEIVKMKSVWRGNKILYRSDPRGDLRMTKPVPTVPRENERCQTFVYCLDFLHSPVTADSLGALHELGPESLRHNSEVEIGNTLGRDSGGKPSFFGRWLSVETIE
jgi:hypothetical protein